MTDPRKKLVLVVVLLTYLSAPALCFTQDLQEYTQEISRRSFALMDGVLDNNGLVMKIGYPIFIILTFCSVLNQLIGVLSGIPFLGSLFTIGGPLGMILGLPSQDLVQARDGENRDQRLLDYVEDQVRTSVVAGQSEFENELKKKKK